MIAYTQTCTVVPLDAAVALLAAWLHRTHGLETADAGVDATAQLHGAELLTGDAHFRSLAGVACFQQPARG